METKNIKNVFVFFQTIYTDAVVVSIGNTEIFG